MSAYQETKIHGTPGFPYIVYPGILPEHISGIPHHWHEEMEIIYVTDGMISVSVGNNEYALSVGDIILVHPQTIHAIRQHNGDSAIYYNILFRLSMLENAADDTCREKYLEPIYNRRLLMPEYLTPEHPLHSQIEPIIRKLTTEPHYQRFHEELLIKARTFEMLHRILPFCEKADIASANEDIAYEKLKRSLLYLEEHYADNITVEAIAAQSNYSASHFAKLFRQLTGDSFTQYLKNYRLEMAAVRLRNEKTKISEIALSCGFSNLSYFSRAFFEKYGLNPSDYRKFPVPGSKSIDKEDAVVKASGAPISCCGEIKTEIVPGTTDAAVEKHVPVVEIKDNTAVVTVGEVAHPMAPEHYIEWIAISTDRGDQRKKLEPGEEPKVSFALCEGEKFVAAYAYCNLHRLWKS